MKTTTSLARFACVTALLFLTIPWTHASVPPGTIWRPAGLQWYVRGAHNTELNEYFIVWADGVSAIRGMRLTKDGLSHPTDPVVRTVDTGLDVHPDIAYNPNASEYLVVWSDGDLDNLGDIFGRFMDSQGQFIGNPFPILGGAGNQNIPRLVYNAIDDVYMVVCTSKTDHGSVYKVMVAGDSSNPIVLGPPYLMETTTRALHPHSAMVDWNPYTNKFLVAWTSLKSFLGKDDDLVRVQLFNGDGTEATARWTLADQNGAHDSLPTVAANSRNGQFLVTFQRATTVPSLNVWGVILDSNGTTLQSGIPIGKTLDRPDWRSHAAYNEFADTYFVTWTQGRSCGGSPCDDVNGRAVAPDGTLGEIIGIADSTAIETHGSYDGFMSWADLVSSTSEPDFFELYQISQDDLNGGIVTFPAVAMAMVDQETPVQGESTILPFTVSGWAIDTSATSGIGIDLVEIWATPAGGTSTKLGQVVPNIYRSDVEAQYGSQFANSGYTFQVSSGLVDGSYSICSRARSTVTGTFDAQDCATITVGPNPEMSIDAPSPDAVVAVPFVVAGWALDRSAPVDTGVDLVHVWAFPTNGAEPVFLGATIPNLERPDLGTVFGTQFTNSGYHLGVNVKVPNGYYTLVVYARSTLTGTFNNWATVSIQVNTPSNPVMYLDLPVSGTAVAQPFLVAGWAIDLAAATGTGVNAVHVWAFPMQGGAATFLGEASPGFTRPDVGAVFGSQYTDSGFNLIVTGGLAPGNYYIVAYALSAVSGTFNNQKTAAVTVVLPP